MRDNIFLVYWIKIKQTLMDIPEISQIGKNLPVLYEVEEEPEKFVHSIDFLWRTYTSLDSNMKRN